MTDDQCRREFRKLMTRALEFTSRSHWMAMVRYNLTTWNPRPIDWVEAARATKTICQKCHGKGTIGAHGQYPCRRCRGKGEMGQADYRRCWAYDRIRELHSGSVIG